MIQTLASNPGPTLVMVFAVALVAQLLASRETLQREGLGAAMLRAIVLALAVLMVVALIAGANYETVG